MTPAGPTPPRRADTPPNRAAAAIERARAQLRNEEGARLSQEPPAAQRALPPSGAPGTPPPAPPTPPPATTAVDFSGSYTCNIRMTGIDGGREIDTSRIPRNTSYSTDFAIRRNGAGWALTDGEYSIPSTSVAGNRVAFHTRTSGTDQWMLLGAIEVSLTLDLNGGTLEGSGVFTAGDGLRATYTLSCTRGPSK